MTEKIMIDGLDVSECVYLKNSKFITCEILTGTKADCRCQTYPNCYYKQLKREEKIKNDSIQQNLIYLNDIADLREQLKRKEQECEELEEKDKNWEELTNKYLDKWKNVTAENILLQQQLTFKTKQLEVARETLKSIEKESIRFDDLTMQDLDSVYGKSFYKTNNTIKQALQKIEELEPENV